MLCCDKAASKCSDSDPEASQVRVSKWCFFGVSDLCATFGFRVVSKVVLVDIKASKMAPKGAKKCQNELKLVPNGDKNHRKRCGLGGLVGKYLQPYWSAWDFENWRAFRLVFA